MGQTVGAAVEFGIGQRLLAVHGGNGFRSFGNLGLEQRLQRLVPWVIRCSVVECFKQTLTFQRRNDRHIVQSSLRTAIKGLDQLLQGVSKGVTDTPGTDFLHRQHAEDKALTQVIHGNGQWIVGALCVAQAFDTFPGRQGLTGGHIGCAVTIIEQ
ncbi:hypothetical protein PSCICM_50890 [Pseudomonas cichorii]|nr:hypothetical protein PSCICM_50890 [Pseudomonas cichorii]